MSRFNEHIFGLASVTAPYETKRHAFGHVRDSINTAVAFPLQIFIGNWSVFRFFESDRLFSPRFAMIAAGLLTAEGSQVCCVVNLSETDRMAYEEAAMLFIDANVESESYDAALRRGGPANGWLFGMDRYASASDRGEWIIYCEKQNDIAVIAFRELDDTGKYVECLKKLHAEPITLLLDGSFEARSCPSPWCKRGPVP